MPSVKNSISQQLEQLNTILAEKNNHSRRIWKAVKNTITVLAIVIAVMILFQLSSIKPAQNTTQDNPYSVEETFEIP